MGFGDARRFGGAYRARVLRTERVTPHMVRVTLGGDELRHLPAHGFDQWFRLFLPRGDGETDFGAVPERFGLSGYLKYLTTRSGSRPPFRNYTVRAHRPEAGELDVDFVVHGEMGIAGPWAQRAQPGEQVALIDQGRGFDPVPDAASYVLVGDESALPAICGILRDLPRDAVGQALIEVAEPADEQPYDAPAGMEVRWLPRADAHARPGTQALAALLDRTPGRPEGLAAYLAGEQALVAGGRRHLVAAGVPKAQIAFTGYWKVGSAG
jgi:NADPH-dependent ferric siderophore reductase